MLIIALFILYLHQIHANLLPPSIYKLSIQSLFSEAWETDHLQEITGYLVVVSSFLNDDSNTAASNRRIEIKVESQDCDILVQKGDGFVRQRLISGKSIEFITNSAGRYSFIIPIQPSPNSNSVSLDVPPFLFRIQHPSSSW
jgi:hypothetical protein